MIKILLAALLASGLFAATQVSANAFGRLFTSPDERTYLDKVRSNYKFGRTVFKESSSIKPVKPKRKPMVFNGVVRRNDVKKEIWINGKKVKSYQGIYKSENSNNDILVKQNNRKNYIAVRPGQTVDSNSGEIAEPYQSLSRPKSRVKNAAKKK